MLAFITILCLLMCHSYYMTKESRFDVPADLVPWSVSDANRNYMPLEYNHPELVMQKPGMDPLDPSDCSDLKERQRARVGQHNAFEIDKQTGRPLVCRRKPHPYPLRSSPCL
jgi:hypothetical protein